MAAAKLSSAFQHICTVPYHTVSTHLVSVQGQTPQTVTVLTVQNGLMSLAPTNGASVWLGRKNPVEKKIVLSQVGNMLCVDSFEVTNNKRKCLMKRVRRQV